MNYMKTALLLAGMTALFAGAGYLFAGPQGMMIALLAGLAMNVVTYWNADRMVLGMYHAQPLESGPVHAMVHELSTRANLPMPGVYLLPSSQPNAFATGRNPEHAAVAVSQGLLDSLSEREVRGVIAHELAHIRNRDTLIMTITATLAGALGMLANLAIFTGGRRDEESSAGPIAAVALMILAPVAAMLVQMAISRTREYAADRTGADIADDPLALASALERIEHAAHRIGNHAAERNPATAHLFIVNPLSGSAVDNLFSTHPNTANRVRALIEMAGTGHSAPSPQRQRIPGPWERQSS